MFVHGQDKGVQKDAESYGIVERFGSYYFQAYSYQAVFFCPLCYLFMLYYFVTHIDDLRDLIFR